MLIAFYIVLALFTLIALFHLMIHPLVCIVECILSKELSGTLKTVWIVATLLTGFLAAIPYAIFGTKSAGLRRFSIRSLATGFLFAALSIAVGYSSPDVQNMASTAFDGHSQGESLTAAFEDIGDELAGMEDFETKMDQFNQTMQQFEDTSDAFELQDGSDEVDGALLDEGFVAQATSDQASTIGNNLEDMASSMWRNLLPQSMLDDEQNTMEQAALHSTTAMQSTSPSSTKEPLSDDQTVGLQTTPKSKKFVSTNSSAPDNSAPAPTENVQSSQFQPTVQSPTPPARVKKVNRYRSSNAPVIQHQAPPAVKNRYTNR